MVRDESKTPSFPDPPIKSEDRPDRGIQKILDCPVKPDNDKLVTISVAV